MQLQHPVQSRNLDLHFQCYPDSSYAVLLMLRRFACITQIFRHYAVSLQLRNVTQWVRIVRQLLRSHCADSVQQLRSGCAELRSSAQPLRSHCAVGAQSLHSGCAAITQWCAAIAQRLRITTVSLCSVTQWVRSHCAVHVHYCAVMRTFAQWVRSHCAVRAQPLRSACAP